MITEGIQITNSKTADVPNRPALGLAEKHADFSGICGSRPFCYSKRSVFTYCPEVSIHRSRTIVAQRKYAAVGRAQPPDRN